MVKARVLSEYKLPKAGHTNDECEDAFSTKPTRQSLKVFVADGATESSFAKEWANLLTDDLKTIRSFSLRNIVKRLPKIRNEWKEQVSQKPLPWYAEIKLEKGAFSTIIGLWINYKKSSFNCFAIGDCCIFHLRNDEILASFPIEEEIEFSNNPFLVSTKIDDDDKIVEHFRELKNQKIRKGDYLFVMSDALACWFMNKIKTNDRPWETLIGFTGESLDNSFEEWLKSKRDEKEIKNDDTTLLTIEIL
jgi:hypothetical protein